MSRNEHEERGRSRKVADLVDAILKLDQPPSADDVAGWSSGTWKSLTDVANALRLIEDPKAPKMKPPSDVSRALVVEELRRRERAACRCFAPPEDCGDHERACPLSNVRSLAEARSRKAS